MVLHGQVALVLGGASGIGFAAAHELLKAGANVAVSDISSTTGVSSTTKLQDEFGAQRCFFVQADVRQEAELEAAITATKKKFSKMDILVNSAGLLNDYDWNLAIDVNLKGIISGTLLAWKHMGKQEGGNGGTVVNIASILGLDILPCIPVYTASKHAVVGWGRSCGDTLHLDRTGVRILTLCPGVTETSFYVPTGNPRHLCPEALEQYKKEVLTYPAQKADVVGRAVRHVIQHAASGSVWVSEDSEDPPYEVAVPEYKTTRVAL